MDCCCCEYLNENDKKEGKCNGAQYYCKKKKQYVNGSCGCDSFSKDYARKSYIVSEIFTDGKIFYNDDKDVGIYVFILIIMILLGTIVKLFN